MSEFGIPQVMALLQFFEGGVMQIGEVIQTLDDLPLAMSSLSVMKRSRGVANDSRLLPYLRLRPSTGLHAVLLVKPCG